MPHDPLSAVVAGTYVGLLCAAAVAVWLGGEWAMWRLRKAASGWVSYSLKPFIFQRFRAIFGQPPRVISPTPDGLTKAPE